LCSLPTAAVEFLGVMIAPPPLLPLPPPPSGDDSLRRSPSLFSRTSTEPYQPVPQRTRLPPPVVRFSGTFPPLQFFDSASLASAVTFWEAGWGNTSFSARHTLPLPPSTQSTRLIFPLPHVSTLFCSAATLPSVCPFFPCFSGAKPDRFTATPDAGFPFLAHPSHVALLLTDSQVPPCSIPLYGGDAHRGDFEGILLLALLFWLDRCGFCSS